MARLKVLGTRIAVRDTRALKPPPKVADPFYLSPEWRTLVEQIIEARGRICEDPACPRPHPLITRVFGDHIIELKDQGARLDPANVMLRCGSSHTRKTLKARGARAAKQF